MSQIPISAQKSQGLIQHSNSSKIDQHYGDKQNLHTEGGDYAGRDIHKRGNTYITTIFSSDNVTAHEMSREAEILIDLLKPYEGKAFLESAFKGSMHSDAFLPSGFPKDLREMVRELDDHRVAVANFLQWLVTHSDTPEQLKLQIASIPLFRRQSHRSQLIPASTKTSPQANLHERQSYIQFVVRPLDRRHTDKLSVRAWLIPDDRIDSSEKHEPIDISDSMAWVPCDLNELPVRVNECIEKASERLEGNYESLTLEMFLPIHLLSCSVDTWEEQVEIGFGIGEPRFIGEEYRVVVRSEERQHKEYMQRRRPQWLSSWSRLSDRMSVYLEADDLEHLEELSQKSLCNLSRRLEQKVGLKLTSCLTENDREKLFGSIIFSGTPFAIWHRCKDSTIDVASCMEKLLLLKPLSGFLNAVLDERKEAALTAPDPHAGSYLSVLWENPHRLTPLVSSQLIEPTCIKEDSTNE